MTHDGFLQDGDPSPAVQGSGMRILWKYLKPHKRLIIISLLAALLAQLLSLIDHVIFGKIIDDFASGRGSRPENELVHGVLFWLALATSLQRA